MVARRLLRLRSLAAGFVALALISSTWGQVQDKPEKKVIRFASAGTGWGGFLKISLWLADNLLKRDTTLSLWVNYAYTTGRGFRDNLLMLADGQAEVAVVNSHGLASMASRGRGLFERPVPLRAIAALPQGESWCMFGVDASLGIKSFADLREKKVPLKFATGYRGELINFMAHEVLRRHGIDPEELKRRGGEFLEGFPRVTGTQISSGQANAFFQEGASRSSYGSGRPMAFLGLEPEVAKQFEDEFGWKSVTLPPNTLAGQKDPILVLDFSDWLICVREDMSEDLAYRLAQTVVEEIKGLEQNALSNAPGLTGSIGVDFPVDPRKVGKTSIPLHPGAARYYKEKGLL
ncbi:MAG: TAXI family TRAP transporter solute-binding subunit [Acidobacteria bacterium]|nr:TAXI family TRAP transporter solute-binding subunit [Acidobacteriota bacterium]